jgi:hypothetical protein
VKYSRLGFDRTDLLVVIGCTLAFVLVVAAGKQGAAKHPPITLIAQDLGTTPEEFRRIVKRFIPHPRAAPPSEIQRRQIADELDVSVEQLDTVIEKHRPDRLHQQ